MNIRNELHYQNSFWDWSFLNDCFGDTKIRVSDLDGVIERKGNILILETKEPNVSIPYGQQLLFEAIQKNGHTVIVAWGSVNNHHPVVTKMMIYHPYNKHSSKVDATILDLHNKVANWYRFADENPFRNQNGDLVKQLTQLKKECALLRKIIKANTHKQRNHKKANDILQLSFL